MFAAKKFYAQLVSLNLEGHPFICIPLSQLPATLQGKSEEEAIEELKLIQKHIVNKPNDEIKKNKEAMSLLRSIGQDQTIVTYMFNFRNSDGSINSDASKMSELNNELYKRLSFSLFQENIEEVPLIVTASEFPPSLYGDKFMDFLYKRARLNLDNKISLHFLISTFMNPWITKIDDGFFLHKYIKILTEQLYAIIEEKFREKNNISQVAL